MCVCIHTHSPTHPPTHPSTHPHTHTHTHIHTHAYACMHVHFICTYVHAFHMHMYVNAGVSHGAVVYAYMYAHSICMYVHAYMYMQE